MKDIFRGAMLALVAICDVGALASRSSRVPAQLGHFLNSAQGMWGTQQACGVSVPVHSSSSFRERCPAECPLYVDVIDNELSCDFACVGNSVAACSASNPGTPIADTENGFCRRCQVIGCDRCRSDGTERCEECFPGYVIGQDGQCYFSTPWLVSWCLVIAFLVIVLLLVIFVIVWIADMCLRPASNAEGLKQALAARSRAKIHMPKVRNDEPRKLWPLNTNLCLEPNVAGVGVALLFNFQAAIIIWAFVMAIVWYGLAAVYDWDLLRLGTRESDSPRQDCILVKWGYETQQRLMYLKVGYLLFAYIFSFLGAICFAIRQWRMYRHHSQDNTHKDFCVELRGLPEISGEETVEVDLRSCIEAFTKKTLVGVSVGWQVGDIYEDLLSAMQFRLGEIAREKESRYSPRIRQIRSSDTGSPKSQAGNGDENAELDDSRNRPMFKRQVSEKIRHSTLWLESLFISPATQKLMSRGRKKKPVDAHTPHGPTPGFLKRDEQASHTNLKGSVTEICEEDLIKEIQGLRTSTSAFAVFQTEGERDAAFDVLQKTPMAFRGKVLSVNKPEYEPSAVLWENLSTDRGIIITLKRMGLLLGMAVVIVILLVVFEVGYMQIQLNTVNSTGEEAMTVSFLLFTFMIVITMALLCTIAATVADWARFERVGNHEVAFVLLYTFSVLLQVGLDLLIAYWVGKRLMEVNDYRLYDGTRYSDMTTETHFTKIFEGYAMQKQLGITVVSFGFPCAFLLPFLAEPIVSIYLPYKVLSLIVRSHPELKGHSAEQYLEAVPMDLGRYGDIMINVFVCALILYFPGGYNLTMFLFLGFSHLYIYWYDHMRVLRSVQSIYISSYSVDWWAQWLFGIACALMLSCLVFKANCEENAVSMLPHLDGLECVDGLPLVAKVLGAFFFHIVVHTLFLFYVVPFCGKEEDGEANSPYAATAQRYPCSWFSGNLVHCLRSEYIYQHAPPFDYCIPGKEHLMRCNPEIGAFFTDDAADVENFDERATFSEAGDSMRRSISHLARISGRFGF